MTDNNDGVFTHGGSFARAELRPRRPAVGDTPDTEALAAEDGDEPQDLITTIFMSGIDDAIEAMQAADTLGLGIRVHNRWIEEEAETQLGQWVVELFTDGLHVGA